MNNGGYIMVDMTGWDIGSAGKISGIYKRLSDALATGKPVFISGAVANGTLAPFCARIERINSTTIGIFIADTEYEVGSDDSIGS